MCLFLLKIALQIFNKRDDHNYQRLPLQTRRRWRKWTGLPLRPLHPSPRSRELSIEVISQFLFFWQSDHNIYVITFMAHVIWSYSLSLITSYQDSWTKYSSLFLSESSSVTGESVGDGGIVSIIIISIIFCHRRKNHREHNQHHHHPPPDHHHDLQAWEAQRIAGNLAASLRWAIGSMWLGSPR